MRETGAYLEPTLGYRPHWTKAPLTYWMIAAGLSVAGDNPWGARAYNVVAFAITAVAVAATGAALWNPATGWLAGLVYVSSLLPPIGAAIATADTLLTLWMALALLAYVRAWRAEGSRWWVRAMWVCFGLGFFTKGPPALLFLLALAVFHVRARRPFRLADPAGLALFAATGLWWYGFEMVRHSGLASYFVGQEVVARNFSAAFRRNAQWYGAFIAYGPMLAIAPGVWLVDAWRIARREQLFAPHRIAVSLRSRTSPGALLLCWFFVPLVFFSLSRSRLPLYPLPLYTAIALAIARGLAIAGDPRKAQRRVHRVAAAAIAALIALKGVAAWVPSPKDATRTYREAVRAAGPDARFALFFEPRYFGFEFHAGPEMERLTPTGRESWADRSLEDAVTQADPARSYAILARRDYAPGVEAFLREKNVPYTRRSLTYKELFLIGRRPT